MTVAFSWNELPAYGAKLLREGIVNLGAPVEIVATRPTVPIEGMEDIVQQPIRWIPKSGIRSWEQLGLAVPRIFFQAGWYIDSFIHLGREVRRHEGKVVLLADNSWKNSPRQWFGSLVFRAMLRRRFDAVWVTGDSGARLMRAFGMPPDRIFKGLYGSDPATFPMGPALTHRRRQLLYVGRLIPEKGIVQLAEAFSLFRARHPEWTLVVFGDGPLRDVLEFNPGVIINGFAQPAKIAAAMRDSRFLVLPSLTDHWPLVVSEAALSGCGLLLSTRVGNISEFVDVGNGTVFKPGSTKKLLAALMWSSSLSEPELGTIADLSRARGLRFTPTTFANVFERIVHILT